MKTWLDNLKRGVCRGLHPHPSKITFLFNNFSYVSDQKLNFISTILFTLYCSTCVESVIHTCNCTILYLSVPTFIVRLSINKINSLQIQLKMLEVHIILLVGQKRLFSSYMFLKSAIKVICKFIVIYKGVKYNFLRVITHS